MNKQTQMLLLLGLAGAAAYFFLVKKPADDQKRLGYTPTGTAPSNDSAARIAEANASAAAAQAAADAAKAQAEAAEAIAKAQQTEWYMPLMQGIGEGTGQFLGGLTGFFGK